MERLHHYFDTLGAFFQRQAPEIVCTQINPDGTLASFTINGDMEVTRTEIAARIGTTAGELDELRHNGGFVLFCKSSMSDTINPKACDILGKPGQVRGPAFVVRHTSPLIPVFSSCAPEDVVRAFPNIIQRPVVVSSVTMQVDKEEVEVSPQAEQEDEGEIGIVIAQAVETFKKVDQRIIIDDDDDHENPVAGKRGLPVRRGKTAKTLRRSRKREKEEEDGEQQTSVRRSSRLQNKRKH